MADVRFIEQGHEILGYYGDDGMLFEEQPVNFIAGVARTCYKSKPKADGIDSPCSDVRIDAERDANERLVRSLIRNGHHAMLEHSFLSVRFVTDRAIANELVRHRHFSFAQESTRYVNSSKHGFEFVLPEDLTDIERTLIMAGCYESSEKYQCMIYNGTQPETARSVLPLCLATRIVVSGNFREWRHMFKLRIAKDAHPQMRSLMMPLLQELKESVPVVFEDIEP